MASRRSTLSLFRRPGAPVSSQRSVSSKTMPDFSTKLMRGLTSVINSVTSVFDEPLVLMVAIVAMILAYTHATDPGNSLLRVLTEELKKIKGMDRVANAILEHEIKIIGAAIFFPAVLSVKPRWQLTLGAIVAVAVYVLPPKSFWAYASASAFLRSFFRTNAMGKVVLAAMIAALVIWSPNESISPGTLGNAPSPPANRTG